MVASYWIQKRVYKLYIALSLFVPYFTGLGLLVYFLPAPSIKNIPKTNQDAARFIATAILLGISLNHLLMLLIHDMKMSLFIGAILSVTGFCYAIYILRNSFTGYFKLGPVIGAIVLVTVLVFSFFILITPIEWDAQYIWFFHGKMIFYSNGLNQATGLSNPAYQFSHVDYPKLIAILSAQFASLIGYWNDTLPRLSLLVLLVPTILGVTSFYKKLNISFLYLYLMVFFSLNTYTVNGYMDAYLAIYACISLLFFWQGITRDNTDDIVTGCAFISIIPLFKNEGMLFLISIILGVILIVVVYKSTRHLSKEIIRNRLFWAISALLVVNIAVWSWLKYRWGLKNDLNLGLDSIQLIINRVNDDSVHTILRLVFSHTNIGISLLILLVTIFFSIKSLEFRFSSIALCTSVTLIYFTGMVLIYLATPHDLAWHLSSSISRTMMTVNLSIIAANYSVLTTIDNT